MSEAVDIASGLVRRYMAAKQVHRLHIEWRQA